MSDTNLLLSAAGESELLKISILVILVALATYIACYKTAKETDGE